MPRFAASCTVNFICAMCSGDRYFGSPRPGETFTTNMPLAASWSRFPHLLVRASGPFQLAKGWIAPYSRGGVLKFAAASRIDGTVICRQGRWAHNTGATVANRAAYRDGERIEAS